MIVAVSGDGNGSGTWSVYLSGEIHSDWRERIAEGVREAGLPVELFSPVTDHSASDDVGVDILGAESEGFWKDHKGAGVNAVRTQTLLRRADVVVVRFGDKYRQWNAAFEAGYAAALGKPLITLHDEALTDALKEVDRAATATAETPEQVVEILSYASPAPASAPEDLARSDGLGVGVRRVGVAALSVRARDRTVETSSSAAAWRTATGPITAPRPQAATTKP